ncbi:glycoside hydrolase family 19 protein [Streptomyces sp. NPDC088354]|uniref:glycoside hydrolase family 19 protein n=1 Tax=Streptomyces sp. NPDC088354 TaxID=3365856 RepID=UPI0037FC350C
MARSLLNRLIPVRFGSVLVTVVLGSALGVAQAEAASPTVQITGYAGKCIDVAGARTANGTPVQLFDCNGTDGQKWTIAPDPLDRSLRSLGKCLDVVAGSVADGAQVQLYDCNGTGSQRWVVNAAHDIVNLQAHKCLDVTDWNSANRTRLQIWTCTGTSNQKWWATGGATSPSPGGGTAPGSGGGTTPNHDGGAAPGTGGGVTPDHGSGTAPGNGGGTTPNHDGGAAPGTGGGVTPDHGSGTAPGNGGGTTSPSSGFVVSESQFNQMFSNRQGNNFYTYSGLVAALGAYPGFAKTGSDSVKKQEAAAFLANVSHETGGLAYVTELNHANYSHYCDSGQPYGCPAGQSAYYGRGPLQLSWNTNYKAAGDALGIDLLHNPYLVQNDPAVAWKTALWFWNTQSGAGYMTAHNAMVNGSRFGETVRSINGSLECNGRNPGLVQSRISAYQRFVQILGTNAGSNLWC